MHTDHPGGWSPDCDGIVEDLTYKYDSQARVTALCASSASELTTTPHAPQHPALNNPGATA